MRKRNNKRLISQSGTSMAVMIRKSRTRMNLYYAHEIAANKILEMKMTPFLNQLVLAANKKKSI